MAGPTDPPVADAVRGSDSRWRRWLWLPLLVFAAVSGLVVAAIWFLSETGSGRAMVARQVSSLTLQSGLGYRVGRIDGSLLSAFTIRDLVVVDLEGDLAKVPTADVRWEPLALLGGRIVVSRLDVPEVRLLRVWAINPRDPDEPLLPDINIRIDRYRVGALIVEEPVLGRREVLSSIGRFDISDGRLLMNVQASAASGDRLLLVLDAEPDGDRFDLDLGLSSPADGALATALGLDQPVALTADGGGSWSQWRGALVGEVGSARVIDAQLLADGGRFRLTGDLMPAGLLPDAAARLASPAIAVDAAGSRKGDRLELAIVASAPAFALSGSGAIDLDNSQLDAVRADLLVRNPELLSPDLEASNLRLAMTAEGAMGNPDLGWQLTADSIGVRGEAGRVGARGLEAKGEIQLARGDNPLASNVRVSARSLEGLPAGLLSLLEEPLLTGRLVWSDGDLIFSDGQFRTTEIAAQGEASQKADGRLTASVSGKIARLPVDGLGVIRLSAQIQATRAPGAGLVAAGRFDGRTLAISNSAAADFLGGPARLQGQFRLAQGGEIQLSAARLISPQLTMANGAARFDPASGRFALDIDGQSARFGPIAITASGTADAPTATIRMASPDFGVGLTDLVARIAPVEGGIAIAVTGASPEGPLDGRGRLLFGGGEPVVADIERVTFAGLTANGLLTQSAAGPFVGTISLAGQGIDGSANLADRDGIQHIALSAEARGARLPFDTPIQISNGSVALQILLTPGTPQLVGGFDLSGVRRDALVLSRTTGQFALDDNRTVGKVQLAGRYGNGLPFSSALAVQGISDGYAVMLNGKIGTTPIKLQQPAQIVRREGGGWEVKGTRLQLPGGSLQFSGEWRDPIIVRLVLDDLDLRILDAVARNLGLSGTVSGQLNVQWDKGFPVPLGAADLKIRQLDRASQTGTSVPVDIAVSARSSTAEGVLIGGAISWQDNQLGRLLLKVAPADAENPIDRLLEGALSGGIRYNGPVEPIWALSGLSGQELRGPIAIRADVAGTIANPTLVGQAAGRGLLYRNVALGTEVTDIAFKGDFQASELKIRELSGKTAGGSLSGAGTINVNPTGGSIDLGVELVRSRLADSDTLSVTLSGPLRLTGEGRTATLSGKLRVDTARIQLVQFETSEVPALKVRRAGDTRIPPADQNLSAAQLALDIAIVADDRIQVEGMGLDSLWRANVRVQGTAAQPMLVGRATLASGDFSFASSRFDLTNGLVVFNGTPMASAISIEAETEAADVTAFVTISGTAGQPEIRFRSSPALPEDEILARLLFGTSVAQLSVTEALQLATAIAGLQSGVDTMGKIRRSVGVDRLRLVGEDSSNGMGTGLAVGKRLTRNIYVEVLTDSEGSTLATAQWSLSRTLALLLELSSIGNSSANLRYQRDY